MLLEGSCHCGAVRFSLESSTPVPFMLCYCSICRKTGGGGGYAINIMGLAATLQVQGRDEVRVYRALLDGPGRKEGRVSEGRRHFCGRCGSALWMADPHWEQWVWPLASAIDTPLPAPPERVHLMENHRPAWAEGPTGPSDAHFGEYPEDSIEAWHRKRGLFEEG